MLAKFYDSSQNSRFIWTLPRTLSVINNQLRIRALAKSNNLIFLQPVPPRFCGGNVEHYYHFIVDLILPLHHLIENTPSNVNFVFKNIGPLTEHLQNLFPHRVKLKHEIEVSTPLKKIRLIGMNPNGVYLTHQAIERFSQTIQTKLKVARTNQPNKILLIERLPPSSYFTQNAKNKGGGALRRSIPNHAALASALQAMVKPPFEFHNLQLEKTTLQEQVDYFDKAAIVIAQHGAGLVNALWMRPNSIVVELSYDETRQHFNVISRLKKHQYHLYGISDPHAEVDVEHFTNWMLRDCNFGNFFLKKAGTQIEV